MMPLNLPEKDAPKDDAKPKPTSTAALSARVAELEKLVDILADDRWGKNVRPALPEDETEESGE